MGGKACAGGAGMTAPTLGKEAMLMALFKGHLCVMGDLQLATRSHFSLNVTPFML